MKLSQLLLTITAFSVCVVNVHAQEAQTTVWKGTLNAGGTKLRLELELTESGDNVSGELISLDQGNARIKATDIKTMGKTLSFKIPQLGASFSGKYKKDGMESVGKFKQSGMEFPLTLVKSETKPAAAVKPALKEELKEAWVGKLEMGVIEPVMQFRIMTREDGGTAAYFDSITEGRTGFESEWSIEEDTLKFDIEEIELTYRGKLNEAHDTAEGTWSQGGRAVPLTLKKQATEYDNENVWENRPQKPVGPFSYDAEEVKFENKQDEVTLAGTLTIPKKSGRHPAVVLISGSGPQDRDESLMEHKPFLVLADYLSHRGIAVLRYDDRGTAGSTGEFGKATTEDFSRDASAAVDFLKTHDRIDPKQIGLAGHSEGGLIAPMVVGMRDDVAFAVLMAGPGVDGATIIHSQTEAMLKAAGSPPESIKTEMAASRAIIDIVKSSAPGADVIEQINEAVEKIIQSMPESERETGRKMFQLAIEAQKQQLRGTWMRFFLAYDPRPALSKMECPVLAITGSNDLQVLPELNHPEIEKALTAGNEDFEIVELEGLNHLFQKCDTGSISEYAKIQETINPEALKKIGDWIVDHTTPVK